MKMPNDIDPKMLATCGVNCMVCYRHTRKKNVCNGCKFQDETLPDSCRNCRMYECAKSKDVDYCFRCDEYPCKMIKPLISRYKSVHKVLLLENGNYIRDNGIQAFMKGEKERYSCKKCDGIVDQHYGKCSECEK